MREQSPLSRLLSRGLSVFFHALYHRMAWAYDWVAYVVSVGRWKTWVLSVIPDLPGPRILEIGHGPGHLQIYLASIPLTVFGIDQSRQMGRITWRKMHSRKCDTRLVNGIAQHLPYCDGSFNQVVATFPTPYIFEKHSLEEISRVLVTGGTLVVLPEAWITGSSPVDRIAASAFRLLGQAPDWDDSYLQPFLDAGFSTTIVRREVSGSLALVIKAVKQTALNDNLM